jgi:8-amino-7-oxononanoate synthase
MFTKRFQQKLELQRQAGLFRDPPPIEARSGKHLRCNGRCLLNFASNDYLGLGNSTALRRKTAANFEKFGSSSSSSRLVAGNYDTISTAEKAYADYFGYEQALFYPSGFQANVGLLSTLFQSGDAVLFDKHIHASSVKGLSLSSAKARGYNHNRLDHLEKRLQKTAGPTAVITEALFSMDGDCLDMAGFSALKADYGFFSVVDEAHALGVLGPGGCGLAKGVADAAVGTMGKALGLFGAFVLITAEIKQYLLNFSSPQIYTTTLPEAHAASAVDALELVAQSDAKRRHLSDLSLWTRSALTEQGFRVGGDAHILSVFIGPEQAAADIARQLFEQDIFVLPARYPTVPMQQAILRISLTADHDQEDALCLINTLKEIHANQTAAIA